MLYWNELTGHISNLIPSLNRAIGQYARNCREYKVGLTVNPRSRWYSHKADGWHDMVVIYSTSSADYVAYAEDMLIEHGFNSSYYRRCYNQIRGGGGLRREYPKYYIYIVIYY
jgi:hypothetical protein